jgi:hypothetical protein
MRDATKYLIMKQLRQVSLISEHLTSALEKIIKKVLE